MENKNNLKKRLQWLYVFAIVAILAIFATIPFSSGFKAGWNGNEYGVKLQENEDITSFGIVDNNDYKTYQKYTNAENNDVFVRAYSYDIAIKNYKTDSLYIILFIVITIAALVLIIMYLVMIIKIMNSVRKSIKNNIGFDRRNIRRTRLIAIFYFLSYLLLSCYEYLNSYYAAKAVQGTGLQIAVYFDYQHIIGRGVLFGILILFFAEIFSIGYKLSEEQKFTI